jgi:hypothetical protein
MKQMKKDVLLECRNAVTEAALVDGRDRWAVGKADERRIEGVQMRFVWNGKKRICPQQTTFSSNLGS